MAALEAQVAGVDAELGRGARGDERHQALQAIYGLGPILACHLLAEIGEASRFRRAEHTAGLTGLDPVVDDSGETRRCSHHLVKAGLTAMAETKRMAVEQVVRYLLEDEARFLRGVAGVAADGGRAIGAGRC